MLELVPVAFQSTPLLVLLLTLQGIGHSTNGSSSSQTPKILKRGPEDRIHGKRMLQRPNELRENCMSCPQ